MVSQSSDVSSYARSFEDADEVRTPQGARNDIVHLSTVVVSRITLQPGWTWESSIRPIAQTPSCQLHHIGYALSGELVTRLDDGTEFQIHAGQAYDIPAGHTAWVAGETPFVGLEFASADDYAKPR